MSIKDDWVIYLFTAFVVSGAIYLLALQEQGFEEKRTWARGICGNVSMEFDHWDKERAEDIAYCRDIIKQGDGLLVFNVHSFKEGNEVKE